MGILDGIIIILFTLGILYGTKKGFINGALSLVGLAVIITFSFLFHKMIADVLLKGMPFIKFSGTCKGITSLNILFYEAVGFLLIFFFLLSILGLVLKITGILQKLIDYSIVLTLPSKILGVLVGFVNSLIVIFLLLFILLNINSTRKYVHESKIASFIMQRTFVLSNVTSKYYDSTNEINIVIDNCKKEKADKKVCNANVANVLINYNIVDKEKVIDLIESGKLKNIDKGDINNG